MKQYRIVSREKVILKGAYIYLWYDCYNLWTAHNTSGGWLCSHEDVSTAHVSNHPYPSGSGCSNLVTPILKYPRHFSMLLMWVQYSSSLYLSWESILQTCGIWKACTHLMWAGKLTKNLIGTNNVKTLYSEKSPARPMLFYSTNYWQQFWVQFCSVIQQS